MYLRELILSGLKVVKLLYLLIPSPEVLNFSKRENLWRLPDEHLTKISWKQLEGPENAQGLLKAILENAQLKTLEKSSKKLANFSKSSVRRVVKECLKTSIQTQNTYSGT